MKKPSKLLPFLPMLPLACSVPLALNAWADQDINAAMRVEPHYSVQHSDVSADSLYKLGRHFHSQNRVEDAIGAYRNAIEKDPAHADARNALATIYAEQNRLDDALAELHTALQHQPKLSYVHNNLGYTYLLKKDFIGAIGALKTAIALEPGNQRANANLNQAYALFAKEANGGGVQPAVASSGSGVTEEVAAVAAAAPAAAPAIVAATPAPAMTAPVAAPVATAPEAAKPAVAKVEKSDAADKPVALFNRKIRIEIGNGTQDHGLAKDVAQLLSGSGMTVTRVAGLKPYSQRRTVILYREGFYEEAMALSRSFDKPPAVAKDTRKRSPLHKFDLRLVIGKTAVQGTQLSQWNGGKLALLGKGNACESGAKVNAGAATCVR